MRNRDVPTCARCGEPLHPRALMMGFKVTTQRLMLNVEKARSFAGLVTHFGGNAAIADVFAPGDAVEEPKELRDEFVICEQCADTTILALLCEVNERRQREPEEVSPR